MRDNFWGKHPVLNWFLDELTQCLSTGSAESRFYGDNIMIEKEPISLQEEKQSLREELAQCDDRIAQYFEVFACGFARCPYAVTWTF